MEQHQRRIFLSHRSHDEACVRDFKQTLELLGLAPWLAQDELAAGKPLDRALFEGMRDSCAAVFFVTPSFADDRYLRAEINYAVSEKTQRPDEFSIITLVLADASGISGRVPPVLEPYVWKQPFSDLQAFREIVNALPRPPGSRLTLEVAAPPVDDGMLLRVEVPGRGHFHVEYARTDSVDSVLDRVFRLLKDHVPAYSYLEAWVLEDAHTGTRLIVKEVQHVIPARIVFAGDRDWKVVFLDEPYSPRSSRERNRTR